MGAELEPLAVELPVREAELAALEEALALLVSVARVLVALWADAVTDEMLEFRDAAMEDEMDRIDEVMLAVEAEAVVDADWVDAEALAVVDAADDDAAEDEAADPPVRPNWPE